MPIDVEGGRPAKSADAHIENGELLGGNRVSEPCGCGAGKHRVCLDRNNPKAFRKVIGSVVAVVHPDIEDDVIVLCQRYLCELGENRHIAPKWGAFYGNLEMTGSRCCADVIQ